ncbi:hypothetical protein NPIL_197661 [Nephila pilipes]|uniref:Uncharacterized protein n=1 Tax=Nephila pilipes TaxID=299642 RepID=A0A8X6NKP6_NEPPI|nr:hypothetical protein NPIL_197661 [Nephila pilipes]
MLTLISSLANNSLGEFGVTVVKQLTKHPVTSDVTSCQRSSVLSKTTPNFTLEKKRIPQVFIYSPVASGTICPNKDFYLWESWQANITCAS